MRFSKEEKAMWLEDWRQSGKNVWTYAKENGLIPQTLARWANAKEESKPCFVEVPTKVIPVDLRQEILIEKGEVKIHIPLTVSSAELQAIISALAGAA